MSPITLITLTYKLLIRQVLWGRSIMRRVAGGCVAGVQLLLGLVGLTCLFALTLLNLAIPLVGLYVIARWILH